MYWAFGNFISVPVRTGAGKNGPGKNGPGKNGPGKNGPVKTVRRKKRSFR